MSYYGESPEFITATTFPEWKEFMHYLYLPVRMNDSLVDDVRLPDNIKFLESLVDTCLTDYRNFVSDYLASPYVYVSTRRGYATPGNPLNRPGWHCDDFGGSDINYIWTDRFPTQFLESAQPLDIPNDHTQSMATFEEYADIAAVPEWPVGDLAITKYLPTNVLRLTPYVIHSTPEIPAPGGLRSFVKLSFSKHRYNLEGNSHNYLFDYSWTMHSREAVRNQPHRNSNSDYVED